MCMDQLTGKSEWGQSRGRLERGFCLIMSGFPSSSIEPEYCPGNAE